MGTVVPTIESFLFWYRKAEAKKCTKDHARQMVGMKYNKWWRLCHDYRNGEDISKYFKGATDFGK